ncbi:MAG: leucine--tRNA ligase [Actinomycetota bacterium]
MAREYDSTEIEQRWKKEWIAAEAWAAPSVPKGDKRYTLTMFPYPSGDLHMGHIEIFSIHDAIARFSRMRGHEVLNPIGWDAFGLPAENAAIKRGIHPKTWTYENIAKHRSSMERLGCSFDWNRVFFTCDPAYYRWNQWLFLKLYERGLAYRKAAPANWCPNDKTVLANEQVVDGRCELCDTPVEKRYLTQWFFKITDYADRLLDDMDILTGWTDRVKSLQRNWIGRSYGAEVEFPIEGLGEPVTVYTTRPDTLWGATFFVVAPEHPLLDEIVRGTEQEAQLESFRAEVQRLTEVDRTSTERKKKGMFTGKYATNPVNGERIPVWAADYVLMDYGTGAIMAVPAHDERDFDFASDNGLEIRTVIEPLEGRADETQAYSGPGRLVGSGPFDGTPTEDSVTEVTAWLDREGLGRAAKNFRLRDWLISRQRYWGTPIPVVHCEQHGEVAVPVDQLPVILPDDVDFTPQDSVSPLETAQEWVNTTCPECGGPARRETDTMDTFVDSSWYFLRFVDPHNTEVPFDPDKASAWMPVDQYSGGIEHAVMHLIYSRFIQKFFMDMGLTKDSEPYPALLNQGLITMGGKRMSKSRGNIVEPQEAFAQFGADALRLYMLFSGPPEAHFDWPMEGITAIGRVTAPWLQRVWRLSEDVRALIDQGGGSSSEAGEDLRKELHRTIKVVTADFEAFAFNTAIARLMELVNATYKYRAVGGDDPEVLREVVEGLLKMLAPFAPYITEEQWHRLGHDSFISLEQWPEHDEDLARQEEAMMVVQVNGKVRDTIPVSVDISEDEMRELALASDKVRSHIGDKELRKIITKPPKMISLVV